MYCTIRIASCGKATQEFEPFPDYAKVFRGIPKWVEEVRLATI